MLKKKNREIRKVRILNKTLFDKEGIVMFIAKSKDSEGNPGDRLYNHFDKKIVIGFRSGNDIYRGLVAGYLLGLFSINHPKPGQKYRFLSNETPIKRETYNIINISGIKPVKSILTKFF